MGRSSSRTGSSCARRSRGPRTLPSRSRPRTTPPRDIAPGGGWRRGEAGPPAPQPQPGTPAGLPKFGKGGPVIGIDLGTTNSAAAVLLRGKPTLIQSREGYNTLPSVVALGAGG